MAQLMCRGAHFQPEIMIRLLRQPGENLIIGLATISFSILSFFSYFVLGCSSSSSLLPAPLSLCRVTHTNEVQASPAESPGAGWECQIKLTFSRLSHTSNYRSSSKPKERKREKENVVSFQMLALFFFFVVFTLGLLLPVFLHFEAAQTL